MVAPLIETLADYAAEQVAAYIDERCEQDLTPLQKSLVLRETWLNLRRRQDDILEGKTLDASGNVPGPNPHLPTPDPRRDARGTRLRPRTEEEARDPLLDTRISEEPFNHEEDA